MFLPFCVRLFDVVIVLRLAHSGFTKQCHCSLYVMFNNFYGSRRVFWFCNCLFEECESFGKWTIAGVSRECACLRSHLWRAVDLIACWKQSEVLRMHFFHTSSKTHLVDVSVSNFSLCANQIFPRFYKRLKVYENSHSADGAIFWTQSLSYRAHMRYHCSRSSPTAIKTLRAAGCDEIWTRMLKAINRERVLWQTRVCQMVWYFGKAPKDWQTGVIILRH